jgi:hypothetical protein
MIASHRDLSKRLGALEKKYEARFRVVFDAIRELMRPPEKQRKIGFGIIAPRYVLICPSMVCYTYPLTC